MGSHSAEAPPRLAARATAGRVRAATAGPGRDQIGHQDRAGHAGQQGGTGCHRLGAQADPVDQQAQVQRPRATPRGSPTARASSAVVAARPPGRPCRATRAT